MALQTDIGSCLFYSSGIIATLILYGILQERIMQISYDGELFEYSVFLVFTNRTAAVIFAVLMALVNGEPLRNNAPLWKYATISIANVSSSTCQYEALKYVSFAVQMLGKSFKMMPVMLWGMAVSGKSYSTTDWLVAFAVTGGITEFLMTGPISSSHGDSGSSTYGLMLLLGFLLLDGFTSTFQEKLFKEHTTTKYNQMIYINMGSCVISSATLLLSGRLMDAIGFAAGHPAFVRDAMSLSAAAVSGQWFIYSQVKEFGALVFAATMNVRQVVSILISYAAYGHSITALQIIGLAMVFGALFYKSYLGMAASATAKGEKLPLAGVAKKEIA